jgi:peptidyl-tRNA hydrolase
VSEVDEPAAESEPAEWVLPLVVRIERADPPARTAALEAAGRAVLTLLTDPRSLPGGEWAGPVLAWQDGRIRKVVRRARGAGWQRAAALPGIAVRHAGAELRVYPPVPVDAWPPDLARLQVGGTDLADPADPPPPLAGVPVVWLSPALTMTAGKAMAQVGHAAQVGWWASDWAARTAWQAAGFELAVRTADPADWPGLLAAGLPSVRDAGFTEVAPGSATAVADLPWLRRRGRRYRSEA